VFDETVTINASATNVDSVILSVASGERHDGTAGVGARIVSSTAGRMLTVAVPAGKDYIVEWIEFDANSKRGGFSTAGSSFGTVPTLRYTIWHDFLDTTGTPIILINASGRDLRFHNNIVYNFSRNSSIQIECVMLDSDDADGGCFNNTIYNSDNPGTGDCVGLRIETDSANGSMKNNVVTDTTASGGGTATDFKLAGTTNIVTATNASSDSTAPSPIGSEPVVSSTEFVSITGGSEDLHLKTGAECIDVGTDLGTTPSGVQFDIDGRDRDTEGDTWDIGADEFVASVGGTTNPFSFGAVNLLQGKLG